MNDIQIQKLFRDLVVLNTIYIFLRLYKSQIKRDIDEKPKSSQTRVVEALWPKETLPSYL